jgi:hypothetical protein
MLGEESGSTEDVLRSQVVEPSHNAKRGVDASVMSIGWDAPAVTLLRPPAPLTHRSGQCSSRQGRRHIYTPSSCFKSGGWKANIQMTHCHNSAPSVNASWSCDEVRLNQAHLYSFDRTVHCKTAPSCNPLPLKTHPSSRFTIASTRYILHRQRLVMLRIQSRAERSEKPRRPRQTLEWGGLSSFPT